MHSELNQNWSKAKLMLFRFGFIYLTLYIIPFPLNFIPGGEYLTGFFSRTFFELTDSLAKIIKGVSYKPLVPPNGSGDTTFNYWQVLIYLALAFVGALIWTIVDKRSTNYKKLWLYLHTGLRYYAAGYMLLYGFSKVFILQFQFPPPLRMAQTIGETSPMGLLWTFMGYSAAYNIFTGLGEVIAGFLLFFRRTTVIGALLMIAVMANVVTLNFSYDVPVKLFSTHLLIIAILIIFPHLSNLGPFFFGGQTAAPVHYEAIQLPRLPVALLRTIKFSFIALVTGLMIIEIASFKGKQQAMNTARRNDVSGRYQVEKFIVNSDSVNAAGAERRWKAFDVFERRALIVYDDDARLPWHCNVMKNGRMIMETTDLTTRNEFAYELRGDRLKLKGMINADSVKIFLAKEGEAEFPLASRGFHWINEYPFNQ